MMEAMTNASDHYNHLRAALMQPQPRVQEKPKDKKTLDAALRQAVRVRKSPLVEQLLQKGANPNAMEGGVSVLGEALRQGDVYIAQLLVRHGAALYTQSHDTLWLNAIDSQRDEPLDWLLAQGVSLTRFPFNRLCRLEREQPESLEWFLRHNGPQQCLDWPRPNPSGGPVGRYDDAASLMRVALQGRAVVREALNATWGVDPNVEGSFVQRWHSSEALKRLWANHIIRSDSVAQAQTALSAGWIPALDYKHTGSMVIQFIQSPAPQLLKWWMSVPELKNQWLQFAQEYPKSWMSMANSKGLDVLAMFHNWGMNVSQPDEKGSTWLHAWVAQKSPPDAKEVIEWWARNHPQAFFQANHQGKTPWGMAQDAGNHPLLARTPLLLELQAKLLQEAIHRETPTPSSAPRRRM